MIIDKLYELVAGKGHVCIGLDTSAEYLGLNEKVPGTGKRIETKLGITQKMDQNRAFFSSCRTTEKNKMNIAA